MSNTNYTLTEHYPLRQEVDMTHDLSSGLRRHMPIEYDRLGRYRRQSRPMPWLLACMIVIGAVLVIRVVA